MKSVEWFSAGNLFEPKSVTLTPWGKDVAALNHELKRIGPALAGLRSLDVLRRIPVVLIEPNAIPGRANLAAARFARRIFVQFDEAGAVFERRGARGRVRRQVL